MIRNSITAIDKLRKAQIEPKRNKTLRALVHDVATIYIYIYIYSIEIVKRYKDSQSHLNVAMLKCHKPVDRLSQDELIIMNNVQALMLPNK